jgi:hypothetical protein
MPDPFTPEALDTIEARANAATKGPWFATAEGQVHRHTPGGRKGWWVPEHEDIGGGNFGGEGGGYYMEAADAEFIAHAREDIPALVAELRRLRTDNEAVRVLAAEPCERFTSGTCADDASLWPNAKYAGDRYCWPCNVRVALTGEATT